MTDHTVQSTDQRPPPYPPYDAGERTMLDGWLDFHRAAVVRKANGLSDEAARRSLVPSLTTVAGLVKHLLWVERGWFQEILAGRPLEIPWSEDDKDGEFRITPDETLAGLVAAYEKECARSRDVAAVLALDDVAAQQRRGKDVSLRWVLMHMVEETARHNGHLDILREQLDGVRGDW